MKTHVAKLRVGHLQQLLCLPMRAIDSVRAEAGRGLVGDRYHGSRHRHVTVQSMQELAEAEGVVLCDLAATMDELPLDRVQSFFNDDGIHFTMSGSQYLAGKVAVDVMNVLGVSPVEE